MRVGMSGYCPDRPGRDPDDDCSGGDVSYNNRARANHGPLTDVDLRANDLGSRTNINIVLDNNPLLLASFRMFIDAECDELHDFNVIANPHMRAQDDAKRVRHA
jgi:hypothetical protein